MGGLFSSPVYRIRMKKALPGAKTVNAYVIEDHCIPRGLTVEWAAGGMMSGSIVKAIIEPNTTLINCVTAEAVTYDSRLPVMLKITERSSDPLRIKRNEARTG